MRIFVVDDAPVIRALFARMLTVLGHTVVASESSGQATLERIRGLAPGAVIVDGRLRGTEVVTFIRELRTELPATRVLIVASLEETALVATAAAAGATGVVRRPLAREQIRRALLEA